MLQSMGFQSQTRLSHWTATVEMSQVQWRGFLSRKPGLTTPFAVQWVVLWHCPPSRRSPGCGRWHRPLLTRCCCFGLCRTFPAPLGGGGGVDTSRGVEGRSGKSWAWFGKGACPRFLSGLHFVTWGALACLMPTPRPGWLHQSSWGWRPVILLCSPWEVRWIQMEVRIQSLH